MKILIAEDNHKVRGLLRSCLAGLNAQFVECADGLEAVAACRQHEPDCVLMDLNMPGLDGLSATRLILESVPEARILIVTQFEGPHLRQAALQAGACGYVLKDNLIELPALVLGLAAGGGLNGGMPAGPPCA